MRSVRCPLPFSRPHDHLILDPHNSVFFCSLDNPTQAPTYVSPPTVAENPKDRTARPPPQPGTLPLPRRIAARPKHSRSCAEREVTKNNTDPRPTPHRPVSPPAKHVESSNPHTAVPTFHPHDPTSCPGTQEPRARRKPARVWGTATHLRSTDRRELTVVPTVGIETSPLKSTSRDFVEYNTPVNTVWANSRRHSWRVLLFRTKLGRRDNISFCESSGRRLNV